MPTYEYRCHSCGKVTSVFTRTISAPIEPECGHCRGRDLQRRMSSFAMGKTVQSVHHNYPTGPGAPPPGYYSDPRNIGRYVEESFSRHGLEMPESVRQTIAAARDGDLPKGQEE